MSWTQGIKTREDCSDKEVERMDQIGRIKLGEGYEFTAFVWDLAEPGVIHLDYQASNGHVRSLKFNYGDD